MHNLSTYQHAASWVLPLRHCAWNRTTVVCHDPSDMLYGHGLQLPEERLGAEPVAAAAATAAELILRLLLPDLPWRVRHLTACRHHYKYTQQYGLRVGPSRKDTTRVTDDGGDGYDQCAFSRR